MALLELLASPPGTGKTFYCIELFKKEILKTKSGIESRSFFVLPSREHANRIQSLVLKKEIPGLFNVHILTINDLASKLLKVPFAQVPTDTLRKSIVRDVLEEDATFPYFNDVRNFHGFHELLVDSIKEFKAGLLTVEAFERHSQRLLKDPAFRSKFRDFSVILKKYEARLERLGLQEPEQFYLKMPGKIKRSEAPDLVVFDGFYHFTRAQKALIEMVARCSKRTVVTLTLPNDDRKRMAVFEYAEKTKQYLTDLGFKKSKNSFLINHRTQDEALLSLEQNLFLADPKPYSKQQDSIEFMEAPNARVEIEMIARRIKEICRESSVYWSDICVVLRELRSYEKLIDSVFSSFEIPVHIHERNRLIENGIAKVLYRFLNLHTEGWKRSDLIPILKSTYFSDKYGLEDTLSIENLAVSLGILEGRDQWEELAKNEKLSSTAGEILQILLQTQVDLIETKSILEFERIIFSWLENFCKQKGSIEGDALDLQAIESIRSILRSARNYYGQVLKKEFLAQKFIKQLQDALESALFSVKPPGKNRVQVYDVVMALPKEYRVVIMPGMLEKSFPKSISEDPIFKDHERRMINKKETILEERLPRIAGERYFFYMAVTRAKEKLILSYPRYDGDDRLLLRSFFIEEVERCFKQKILVSSKNPSDFLPLPDEWSSPHEAICGISEMSFRESSAQEVLVKRFSEQVSEWMDKDRFKQVLDFGRSSDRAVVRDPRIKEVFRAIKGPFSATKLETFANCAFKYFSSRVLYLNEPLDRRQMAEMGNLLHETLEQFYTELPRHEKETGLYLKESSVMKDALHRKLESLMIKSPLYREPLYRKRMYMDSMKKTLSLFVEHEKELFMKRPLVPTYFELSFGNGGKSDLDYLRINSDTGSEILIEGQIDRVDVDKNKKKALVIDYKRSSREFTVHNKLKKNLEFQLPIYLLAVRRLLGMEVLGAELRILRETKKEGLFPESSSEILGLHQNFKVYGEDEFENILARTEELIRQNLKRLQGADISVAPKSCTYCNFSSVCRFEPWRLVYAEGAAS